MKKKLDLYLQKNEIGKVVDIIIIPDFSKEIEYEIEKYQLIDFKKIIKSCNDRYYCSIPKIYYNEKSINKKIENLENKIKSVEGSEEIPSGQAFVCFDSLLSVETFLINCQ